MSRLGRRRSLTVASAAALVALIAPAAANAATYTVKPGDGPCGGSDLACGGLVEAADVVGPGDSITIGAGTYPGAKIPSGGVTITGDIGVTINGTMEFSGAIGGPTKLAKVIISQGTGGAPGVLIDGSAGVEISDSAIASKDGHGVLVTNGTLNKIVRSAIVTGGAQSSAVQVNSSGGSTKGLTIESSILVGGAAGVGATSTGAAAPDIQLVLRHITAAASSNGIKLDSSGASQLLGPSVGSIAAVLTDSIALNNFTKHAAGVAGLGANTAEISATRSLQSGDVKALFLDPLKGNYRLRPDSPAIGKGGFVAGESTTDIDGEDRSSAPTDLGADEYNNGAPTAKFVVATPVPRNTQPVTFDASASFDREGTGIAEYHWRYTDGKSDVTTTPTVQHVFADEGDAAAGLIVIDKQGAASPELGVGFKLIDGVPPAVGIAKPKANQTLRVFTSKTTTVTKNGKKKKVTKRTRTRIQFGGLSADKSGVARIVLTLEKAAAAAPKAKAKASATSRCRFYDPRKGFQLVSCTKPKLITARLIKDDKNGQWTYTIGKAHPLSAGRYTLAAYGVDGAGAFGNSAEAKLSKISFTLK